MPCSVLIGYGDQNPLQNVAYLYGPAWTPADVAGATAQVVRYVETDTRLTTAVPAANSDFPGEDAHTTKPLPAADFTKFDHIKGVPRVYDDGDIQIYDLMSLGYVP